MENSLLKSHNGIIYKITWMLNLIGTNSFKDNYTMREALFTLMDIPFYLFVNFYSVWFFRKDFVKVAIILVPSAYGFQVSTQIFVD